MEIKAIYKAKLDRMQEYQRYWLHTAKENGLSDFISKFQQISPRTSADSFPKISPMQLPATTWNPNLAAIADQAKQHGWYIEPNEVSNHFISHSINKYMHTRTQVQFRAHTYTSTISCRSFYMITFKRKATLHKFTVPFVRGKALNLCMNLFNTKVIQIWISQISLTNLISLQGRL